MSIYTLVSKAILLGVLVLNSQPAVASVLRVSGKINNQSQYKLKDLKIEGLWVCRNGMSGRIMSTKRIRGKIMDDGRYKVSIASRLIPCDLLKQIDRIVVIIAPDGSTAGTEIFDKERGKLENFDLVYIRQNKQDRQFKVADGGEFEKWLDQNSGNRKVRYSAALKLKLDLETTGSTKEFKLGATHTILSDEKAEAHWPEIHRLLPKSVFTNMNLILTERLETVPASALEPSEILFSNQIYGKNATDFNGIFEKAAQPLVILD